MYGQTDDRGPLLCPDCAVPFPREEYVCRSCGIELSLPYGIPSFDPEVDSHTDSGLVERIADLTEEKTILEATSRSLEDQPEGTELLENIYSTRNDAWRILVSEVIGGRCLDLYTGFGRRSLALAEIAETVYAVDPDLAKLRTLRYRNDFDSRPSVIPVHADARDLRLQADSFDTVVADFTGRARRSLKTRLESLDSSVREDGSILLFLDGWIRQFGGTTVLGLDESLPPFSERFTPMAVRRTRRLLDTLGYTSVTTYALFPNLSRLFQTYEVGNAFGTGKLFDTYLPSSLDRPFVHEFVSRTGRLGLLDHLYPVYLVVGSKRGETNDAQFSRPVVSTGRSRSVVFESEDDELTSVWKYPNRRRHGAFNRREQRIVEWLRSEEPQVRQTLPTGELIETKFGAVRKERPVTGHPLSETLEGQTDPLREVVESGLEWLRRLQRPNERDRIELSPDEFVERFSVPAAAIRAPRPSTPVEFFETPVHGDFTPENMYADGGRISSIIDWEYGATAANPVIDLGFFLVHCFKGSDLSTTDLMAKLVRGCPSVAPVRDWFRRYAESVAIPLQTVMLLLPTVYVHRIAIDRAIGAESIYTAKERQRAALVRNVWDSYRSGGR